MAAKLKVIKLPKKGKINRFEVREGKDIFDVRDAPDGAGKYKWSCTCGQSDCRHIIEAKGVFFKKAPASHPSEPELIVRGGFRPCFDEVI